MESLDMVATPPTMKITLLRSTVDIFLGYFGRIESYEGVKELAIELGAANPDVVASEWCDKRDTPPLAYTPTPE